MEGSDILNRIAHNKMEVEKNMKSSYLIIFYEIFLLNLITILALPLIYESFIKILVLVFLNKN